jgi:hypothetical protein
MFPAIRRGFQGDRPTSRRIRRTRSMARSSLPREGPNPSPEKADLLGARFRKRSEVPSSPGEGATFPRDFSRSGGEDAEIPGEGWLLPKGGLNDLGEESVRPRITQTEMGGGEPEGYRAYIASAEAKLRSSLRQLGTSHHYVSTARSCQRGHRETTATPTSLTTFSTDELSGGNNRATAPSLIL